jgi:4-aminobutyrate aminotransferase
MGAHLAEGLRALMVRRESIGDVRGIGLMIGVDFVRSRQTREHDPEMRNRVVQEAFSRGLLTLGCGESTLRVSPPLVISRHQVDVAIDILDAAVAAAQSR